MDMGIRGRKAIVCAASQGLGKACALALANEGVDIVINARGEDALQATAAEIRAASGVNVIAVAADVTTAQGRAALLAACPAPDILVNNAGDRRSETFATGTNRSGKRRSTTTWSRRSC
jgi:3-oxoacyl-[acyl-carrier protein] reductase